MLKTIIKQSLYFIFVGLVIALFIPAVNSMDLLTGLIHHYNMSDSVSCLEDAKNSIDGDCYNSPTAINDVPDNFDFSGYKTNGVDEALRFALNEDYVASGAFTACFWSNFTHGDGITVAGFGKDPLIFDFRTDGTNLEWFIRDQIGAPRIAPNPKDCTTNGGDGDWHYYCMGLSNNYAFLTIDGNLECNMSTSVNSGTWTNENYFALGALPYEPTPVNYLKAEFGELSIYDYALNLSTMVELYNSSDGSGYCDPVINPNGCDGSTVPILVINTDLVNNTINFNQLNLDINFNGTITDSVETIFQCNIFNDGNIIDSGEYNLTINNQVSINNADVESDYLISIECNNQAEYTPFEYNITAGTYTSGNISALDDEGVNSLVFNEQTGAPALDLTFGYANITSFDRLHYIITVSGSAAHTIQLQVYNFTSDSWKIIDSKLDVGVNNIEFDLDYESLVVDGQSIVRIYMSTSGNPTHTVSIDYLEFETVSFGDTTEQFLYRVDTVQPKLKTTAANNTNIILGNSISETVEANDTNLFATNYSILDANKLKLKNYFTENLTVNYTSTVIEYTPITAGTYYIRLEAWDSHNPKKEPHEKYEKIEKIGDKTKIKFKKGDINIGGTDIESIELVEENNKYSVIYNFKQKGKNTIILENANEWYLDVDSKYSGHLVNSKLLKYYDLEGLQVDDMYILENQWIIKVDSKNEKTVKTFSIGDLNYNVLEYTYTVAAATTGTTFNSTGLEREISNLNFNLNVFWIIPFLVVMSLLSLYFKNLIFYWFTSIFYFINSLFFIDMYNKNGELFTLSLFSICIIMGIFFFFYSFMSNKKEDNFYNI